LESGSFKLESWKGKFEFGGVQLEFGNWKVYVVIRELEATGGSGKMEVRWKLENRS
jgi:hypothetical protein